MLTFPNPSLSLSATKTNNYQHHITNADHPIKPKTSFKAHPLKTKKKKTNEKKNELPATVTRESSSLDLTWSLLVEETKPS